MEGFAAFESESWMTFTETFVAFYKLKESTGVYQVMRHTEE
jgi:hypothetical protein